MNVFVYSFAYSVYSMNGVLFIDEAYMLYHGDEKSYQREAIDALMKAMDPDGGTIILFAGCKAETKMFFMIRLVYVICYQRLSIDDSINRYM